MTIKNGLQALSSNIKIKDLDTDKLIVIYKNIHEQSELFKGRILLEMRIRIDSNILFGRWCRENIPDTTRTINRLMSLAKLLEDREQKKIPLTACYELAMPKYKDVVDLVFEEIGDKKLAVSTIKKMLVNAQVDFDRQLKVVDSVPGVDQIESNVDHVGELVDDEVKNDTDFDFKLYYTNADKIVNFIKTLNVPDSHKLGLLEEVYIRIL
jgi:hypothetical protein